MSDTKQPKPAERVPVPAFLKNIIFGSLAVIAAVIAISSWQGAHPSAEDAAKAKALMQQQATTYFQEFQKLANHCDFAGSAATALTQNSDAVTGYQALQAAQTACHESDQGVTFLKPPEHTDGDLKAAFQNASSSCHNAFSTKSEAYGELAKVQNGDTSPATQAGARDKIAEGNTYATECSSTLDKAVTGAGGSIKG